MTRDKSRFSYLNENREGNASFGNNSFAKIKGKVIDVFDKGKTKDQNVLYVEGIKYNKVLYKCVTKDIRPYFI